MSVITQWGYSALMVAVVMGTTEVVAELVKAGANVDMQNIVCQYIYVVHVYVWWYILGDFHICLCGIWLFAAKGVVVH